MNRKSNPELVKKIVTSIRFTPKDYELVKKKSKSLSISISKFCQVMSTDGFIIEKTNQLDLNEIRLLRQLLIEYRTNFSRISNLISVSNPSLYEEIREVKKLIENTLNTYRL